MSHSVRHTHTVQWHPLLSTGSFCLRKTICLRNPTCIKPEPSFALSLFFPSLFCLWAHGPLRPRARLWPQVGWWSQQELRLRHTISTRELESLQLEGQRRTSPSLCNGGRMFGKLHRGLINQIVERHTSSLKVFIQFIYVCAHSRCCPDFECHNLKK